MKAQRFLVLALAACACGASAAADKLYRWVDDDGTVHYGDSVPPEYADKDASIFNERGIQVGTIEGPKTPEERAEETRIRAEEARRAEQARLDRVLLETYTTVEEIKILRDRRVELLDARARVTEQYLENLRGRLVRLEEQSARYQGSDDSGAALPEKLAEDIIQTMTAITDYEQRLDDARRRRSVLYLEFEDQIARYRQLTEVESAPAEGAARNPAPGLVETAD